MIQNCRFGHDLTQPDALRGGKCAQCQLKAIEKRKARLICEHCGKPRVKQVRVRLGKKRTILICLNCVHRNESCGNQQVKLMQSSIATNRILEMASRLETCPPWEKRMWQIAIERESAKIQP